MTTNNPSENVVLEIAKKLTPRLLAIILILALVALTFVISLALYRGGSVNLKDMTFSAPNNQDLKISSLEESLERCIVNAKNITRQLNGHDGHPTKEALSECEDKNSKSLQLKDITQFIGNTNSSTEALAKIKNLAKTETDYTKLKQNYFFKLFILERLIPQYGKSISTHYDGENRRDTYKLLQEILLELGFYNENINGSQISTKNAVIEFQKAYNNKIENEMDMNETSIDTVILQPLGHVGYRTLEAFRSWYRNNAV